MLNFKTPTINDIDLINNIVQNSDTMGCEDTFASSFLWGKTYGTQICVYKNTFLKRYGFGDNIIFDFPIGQEITESIHEILTYAKVSNITLQFHIKESEKAYLEQNFPNLFSFTEDRDTFEYIYLQTDLANLSGKIYQKKRNHISKFERTYPNYRFNKITDNNINDALYVAQKWCELRGCCSDKSLSSESCAIKLAFNNFNKLKLFGGVLYVENSPVAMTIASKITDKICDVHFEKALDVDGAYPMINREFAKTLGDFTYINREEDLGIEGLRKAKLSYYPNILLKNYIAKLVQ